MDNVIEEFIYFCPAGEPYSSSPPPWKHTILTKNNPWRCCQNNVWGNLKVINRKQIIEFLSFSKGKVITRIIPVNSFHLNIESCSCCKMACILDNNLVLWFKVVTNKGYKNVNLWTFKHLPWGPMTYVLANKYKQILIWNMPGKFHQRKFNWLV
jgi:hypothetical protein